MCAGALCTTLVAAISFQPFLQLACIVYPEMDVVTVRLESVLQQGETCHHSQTCTGTFYDSPCPLFLFLVDNICNNTNGLALNNHKIQ
jgi:hypothetical protein